MLNNNKYSIITAIYSSLLALLIFTGCGTDSGNGSNINNTEGMFSSQGLAEREIYKIEQKESGTLFAGTSRGLVRFERTNGKLQAPEVFMEEATVRTFVVIDPATWLISAVFASNSDSSNIYRTTDRGESWQMFNNGFGGDEKWIPTTMDNNPNQPGLVFARQSPLMNVGKTENGGESWKSVVQTWESPNFGDPRFVKVDPHNPEVIWAGGLMDFFDLFSGIQQIMEMNGPGLM